MKEEQFKHIEKLFEEDPNRFGDQAPLIFLSRDEYDLTDIKLVPIRENEPLLTVLFARNLRTNKIEGIGIGLHKDISLDALDDFSLVISGWLPGVKKIDLS